MRKSYDGAFLQIRQNFRVPYLFLDLVGDEYLNPVGFFCSLGCRQKIFSFEPAVFKRDFVVVAALHFGDDDVDSGLFQI